MILSYEAAVHVADELHKLTGYLRVTYVGGSTAARVARRQRNVIEATGFQSGTISCTEVVDEQGTAYVTVHNHQVIRSGDSVGVVIG